MKNYYIRVKTEEQFHAAVSWGKAESIIAEPSWAAAILQKREKQHKKADLYVCLPDVMKQAKVRVLEKIIENTSGRAGLVIKNPDELGLVMKLGFEGPLIGDSFLYACNSESFDLYRRLCPDMMFVSGDELTDEELKQAVRGMSGRIIYKGYGYQPLMITSQCLLKNQGKCSGGRYRQTDMLRFRNDHGDTFFSQSSCDMCYSVIYNGQKTFMLDRLDTIPFDNIMLDFTIEDRAQVENILGFIDNPDGRMIGNTTRGHHYKGVE